MDALAGVELVADAGPGPEPAIAPPARCSAVGARAFLLECGAALRHWDLNGILPPDHVATAIAELMARPLRIVQVRALSPTHGAVGRT